MISTRGFFIWFFICENAYAPSFALESDSEKEVNSPPKQLKNKATMSPRSATKTFADNLVGQILMYNDEMGDSELVTLFGQVNPLAEAKHEVVHMAHYDIKPGTARDGRTHRPAVGIAARGWIGETSEENLSRVWISHQEPRQISVTGHVIKAQIIGKEHLDHETGSLAVRRLAQLDELVQRHSPDERARLIIEPDFATHSLAREEVQHLTSVQTQLRGNHIMFDIVNCRYVIAPAVLPQGWCVISWDMKQEEQTNRPPGVHV